MYRGQFSYYLHQDDPETIHFGVNQYKVYIVGTGTLLAISYQVYRVYGILYLQWVTAFLGWLGMGWDSWTKAISCLFGAVGCKLPFWCDLFFFFSLCFNVQQLYSSREPMFIEW